MALRQISQLSEMMDFVQQTARAGQSIALVPTMGALHRGHLSLISQAAHLAEQVVVSIFVNPSQFAPHEDFAAYPRTLSRDLEQLAAGPAQVVFTPSQNDLYPAGFQTFVHNTELGRGLCGRRRPIFFQGVCTVVLKLVNIVHPQVLVFGRKDFQQFKVVERMMADLHYPTRVYGAPLVRDFDGMALSSRNTYLSTEQRQQARTLSQALFAAEALYKLGERQSAALLAQARSVLAQTPELVIEYLSLCRQDTLAPCSATLDGPGIILSAVQLGAVRLIDNMELGS